MLFPTFSCCPKTRNTSRPPDSCLYTLLPSFQQLSNLYAIQSPMNLARNGVATVSASSAADLQIRLCRIPGPSRRRQGCYRVMVAFWYYQQTIRDRWDASPMNRIQYQNQPCSVVCWLDRLSANNIFVMSELTNTYLYSFQFNSHNYYLVSIVLCTANAYIQRATDEIILNIDNQKCVDWTNDL